tara:strand:- start:16740 stop:17648 length:909 start_codon:yes stop_codon:yes gene_type:complete
MNRLIAIVLTVCCLSLPAWAQNDEVYRDNVVLLIDDSGSMDDGMRSSTGREKKMDVAKRAIIQVLGQVPEGTNVGIVTFRRNVIYPLGPVDMNKVRQAVNSVQPGGGTPLGEYMKSGADMLLKQRQKQFGYGSYRLLVVTDGAASDERKMNNYAPEIVARGIILDTIGVDMSQNHSLASVSSSYRKANDPDSLQRAVSEVFAEVGGTGKGSVSLDEAFRELENFPEPAAVALVGAFRSTGNHPIGTEAPKPQQSARGSSSQSPAGGNAQSNGIPGVVVGVGIGAIVLIIFVMVIIGSAGSRY